MLTPQALVDERVAPAYDGSHPHYALDWRTGSRLVGPRDSRRAVPVSDLLLTAMCLVSLVFVISVAVSAGPHPAYIAELLAILVVTVSQPVRHLRLRTSFVLTYAALAAYALTTYLSPLNLGVSPVIVTAPTSLYTVVRWESNRAWGAAALVIALGASVVNPVALGPFNRQHPLLAASAVMFTGLCVMVVTATYLWATVARRRAENVEQELALTARVAAAQAASQERLNLARELHDLVGHGLAAVKVQAAVGLTVGGEDQMRQALVHVQGISSSSLASVREMVALLRGTAEASDSAPLADLRQLPALIETVASQGLDLHAQLPQPADLESWNTRWSALQRLTLSRVTAEALANALKHGSGSADLRIWQSKGWCHLRVTNPCAPRQPVVPAEQNHIRGGYGLVGMRERLRLAGGTLIAGPQDLYGRPGFLLEASFPVPAPGHHSADPDTTGGARTPTGGRP